MCPRTGSVALQERRAGLAACGRGSESSPGECTATPGRVWSGAAVAVARTLSDLGCIGINYLKKAGWNTV